MDALVGKRTLLRTSFSKTSKLLEEEFVKDKPDRGILSDKFAKLENTNRELNECNDQILNLMLNDKSVDKTALEREYERSEEYSDKFITLRRKVDENLSVNAVGLDQMGSISSRSSTSSGERKRNIKLPEIVLKKFDGELLSYLPFWAQFKEIHENEDLSNCEKFHYLSQSMLQGSRAKEFLDSYPVTGENYEKAISAFKTRFGNTELLTEVYVRELLKLVIHNVSHKEKMPLNKLVDKLEAHLRALETLGVGPENNAQWLFPMIESSLSEDILKAWHRSPRNTEKPKVETGEGGNSPAMTQTSRLSKLMEFLHIEVENEERVILARKSFRNMSSVDSSRDNFRDKQRNRKPVASAASLVATKDKKCVFCGKAHDSKECFAARSMSLKERLDKLRELKCCLRCLKPGHFAKQCQRFIQCHICKRSHPIILCPELPVDRVESTPNDKESAVIQTTISSPLCMNEVTLMTLIVEVGVGNFKRKARCLVDCGSQRSYILKSTVKALNLKSTSSENLIHTLFGGAKTESKVHNQYFLKLSPVGKSIEYEFCLLDQDVICGGIPRIPKGPLLQELKRHKVWISDIGNDPWEIEILLGSDIYGKILTGEVIQLEGGLTAINTKLGWTLCGESDSSNAENLECVPSTLVTNFLVQNKRLSDMWDLETIGINDEAQTFSKAVEDQLAHEQFLKGLRRTDSGRYCVSLPWVQKYPPDIPSNRHIAEKRLFSTTRKLRKLNKFDEYNKVFNEWLSEDVIEIVPESEKTRGGHFLPHHPVIKLESSTTKIRPVFDASCKSDQSLSLNDCLIKGPNLVEEIPAILMRFREKAIGVTSDIRRAFLQIGIRGEDQNYLKFLWWVNDKIEEFRHKRVVFGVTSSPYLLAAVISFHLSKVAPELRDLAIKLSNSFYVDNCVTSVHDKKELKDFMSQSIKVMAEAQMELRLWTFSSLDEVAPVTEDRDLVSPVLGLQWDRKNDSLAVHIKKETVLRDLSKRKLLSLVHAVFDPLGLTGPAMLPAKLILQEAWAIKSNWDIPLPDELQKRFKRWYEGLSSLSHIKLSRRIGYGNKDSWSLHVFCDASRNAYATVIFLRSEDSDRVHVKFVASKSRVSPLKPITIPRLELLGCVLSARLAKYIVEALSLYNIPIYYWTDAAVALCWIQREEDWGVFVSNRVKEIRLLTKQGCWRHIPGKLNPADLASRGCTPDSLLRSKWWEGPEFLKEPPEAWPDVKFFPDEDSVTAEKKKRVVHDLTLKSEKPDWFERFSSYSKIISVFSWMLRFISRLRKESTYNSDTLSAEEKGNAEMHLWKLVQKRCLGEKDSIRGLNVSVWKDQGGALRVKTKFIDRDDDFCFLYPLLIPCKHYLTECLIREYHITNCHAGVQILAAKLRQRYWIISSKRNIRSCISRCVICKRFTSKTLSTPPIQLPLDRVRDSAIFETTGVDLCGPLLIKPSRKAWVVLFTCAVYRAVHLELVTSLSTEAFLQALRRFIARRGRPTTVYSDNGTNFTGTDNALKRLDWNKITEDGCCPIKWKFIPPTAAWWGGWWERLIRSVKALLLRILGRSSVNFEELLTILCDVEAVINSRPLTYVSDDADELVPLTPSLFLQDIKQVGVPDLDYIDSQKLNVRVKHCDTLRRELRSRFRKEYLSQLVQKASCISQELKVGDVVLIQLENKSRVLWPMGKIVKVYNSRDGAARVVQIKTTNGYLVRPTKKLYPLEVSTSGDPIVSIVEEKRSRYGRFLKPTKTF